MPFYETVFIARQDLGDAQVKAITDACEKIITDAFADVEDRVGANGGDSVFHGQCGTFKKPRQSNS